jgi:hypothetical protein
MDLLSRSRGQHWARPTTPGPSSPSVPTGPRADAYLFLARQGFKKGRGLELAVNALSLASADRAQLAKALLEYMPPVVTQHAVNLGPADFWVYNYDDVGMGLPDVMRLRISADAVQLFPESGGKALKGWSWIDVVSYNGFAGDQRKEDFLEFFSLDVRLGSELVLECEDSDEIQLSFALRVRPRFFHVSVFCSCSVHAGSTKASSTGLPRCYQR